MYPFQKRELRTSYWICPSGCGCGVRVEKAVITLNLDLLRLYIFQNPEEVIPEEDKKTKYIPPIGVEFLGNGMCAEHATQYTTPDELYQDLKHLHGQAFKPLTCGCSLAYYIDERLPKEERVKVAVNDPIYTHKCPEHSHLDKLDEHFDIVTTENSSLGLLMAAIESNLDENQKAEATPYLQDYSLIPLEWEEQESFALGGKGASGKVARKLSIELPGVTLSAQDKERIHNTIQSQFEAKSHLIRLK